MSKKIEAIEGIGPVLLRLGDSADFCPRRARTPHNETKKKLTRSLPALTQVEKWIAHAKELPRAVHH